MTSYVRVRFWTDAFGAMRCDLTRDSGATDTKSAVAADFEDAKRWCQRNGVTLIDDRTYSAVALKRIQHEAALYKLEHRP